MSKRALRSNFEPGTTREVVRRAQWKALGLSEADMQKPKIAVVNSSSELAICFSHLDDVAKVESTPRMDGGRSMSAVLAPREVKEVKDGAPKETKEPKEAKAVAT